MKLNIHTASDHAVLELSFHRHFARARRLKLRQRLEFSTRFPSVCTHSTRTTTRTAHTHERAHADFQLLRRRPLRSLNLSSAGAIALGGRKGRDRASIEATVAVATLSYGSSGSVRAHVCVLCVLSCVWLGNRVENSSLCHNLRRRVRGKCL